MKQILLAIILLSFYSCTSDSKKTSSANTDSVSVDTSTNKKTSNLKAESSKSDTKEKWVYDQKEDKMTSKKKFFASIDANELLQFDFPYDGGSTATINVRNQDGRNEVMLVVSKGQFISGVDGAEVKIRFDDAPAATYSASGPSDGSNEVLFINNASKFIKKLKSAKKMLVQAEFYDSGNKVMEFDVTGFKWTH